MGSRSRRGRWFAAPRRGADVTLGSKDDPWQLTTPPGSSAYTMYRDDTTSPPSLVCVVGTTTLSYDARAVEDAVAYLKGTGDWVELGAADEQKPARDGTLEAWARADDN